mmetsp:Transcript_139598/g.242922  ORF Transcript_139598/g.242922 Transcript_139598/m.242922 type:complete len:281 (-) Transcript_139598:1168-2010(-)
MLQSGLPHRINLVDVDRTDLVVLPSLKGVDQGAGVARMHVAAFHGHLTRLDARGLLGQGHGGQLAILAILTVLPDLRDDKLMEHGPRGRQLLLGGRARAADDPHLAIRPSLAAVHPLQQVTDLGVGLLLDGLEAVFGSGLHEDLNAVASQVKRDGPPKLGGGSGQEHLLPHPLLGLDVPKIQKAVVLSKLIEDARRCQSVAMHDLQLLQLLAQLVHKQFATTVDVFGLVQCPKPKHLHTSLISIHNCLLNQRVDLLLLRLNKVREAKPGHHPCCNLQAAK